MNDQPDSQAMTTPNTNPGSEKAVTKPGIWTSIDEMELPPAELLRSIRNEIVTCRGKLFDFTYKHGRKDRLGYLEGGLTCIIVSLYHEIEELEKPTP